MMEPLAVDVAIGAQVRLRRQLVGMSLRALGARVGISHVHIRRLERGESSVTAVQLALLAKALRCEMNDLLGPADQLWHTCPMCGGSGSIQLSGNHKEEPHGHNA